MVPIIFPVGDKGPCILHSQCHGYWWPSDARSSTEISRSQYKMEKYFQPTLIIRALLTSLIWSVICFAYLICGNIHVSLRFWIIIYTHKHTGTLSYTYMPWDAVCPWSSLSLNWAKLYVCDGGSQRYRCFVKMHIIELASKTWLDFKFTCILDNSKSNSRRGLRPTTWSLSPVPK